MFEPTSRYFSLETAKLVTVDGRIVAYKRRRFLPDGLAMPLLAEVVVNQGDRLDLLTARTLGDPEQFWRVADANNAMNPYDLVNDDRMGHTVRVAVPES